MVEQHRTHVMADRRIRLAQISQMDGPLYSVRPLISWRALGWCCVAVMICAFLLGLLAIGAK